MWIMYDICVSIMIQDEGKIIGVRQVDDPIIEGCEGHPTLLHDLEDAVRVAEQGS